MKWRFPLIYFVLQLIHARYDVFKCEEYNTADSSSGEAGYLDDNESCVPNPCQNTGAICCSMNGEDVVKNHQYRMLESIGFLGKKSVSKHRNLKLPGNNWKRPEKITNKKFQKIWYFKLSTPIFLLIK